MAKALLGHMATVRDQRLLEELVHLRARVRELESDVRRLNEERDAAHDAAPLQLPDQFPEPVVVEPALT